MGKRGHCFEIVLQPSPKDDPISLGTEVDPNQVTIAFHAHLQRLRRERAKGEVRIVRHNYDRRLILRQPLPAKA